MKFIDEVVISVTAGNGGQGCVSFRREKYIPRGGPDGGDGGKGGDVVIETTARKRTLYQFRFKRQFLAANGGHGQGQQKSGKNGADLKIELPPGTLIFDAQTGDLIKDCIQNGESFVVAKGGLGGRGNKRFSTSTNRAPRYAQPGLPGESMTLQLQLKLLADVGIIGFPNAGKSSLISKISSARPKIADYPFTTLNPVLGMVKPPWGEPFAVADIPGLIEGAHAGAGLGDRFLKHVERTRVLLHLIDAAAIDADHPLAIYDAINRELAGYSRTLIEKNQVVVLNKMDLPDAVANGERFVKAFAGKSDQTVYQISAATGSGIDELIFAVNKIINGQNNDNEHGS